MITSQQILSDKESALLSSMKGHKWIDMSGDGMFNDAFAWVGIRIETDGPAIQIAFDIEVLNIHGEPEDYPVLHVNESASKSQAAIKEGNIYFHGRGETVSEIWLLREKLDCVSNGTPEFSNTADVAVAIKLENIWISLVRSDHFSDAFMVQRPKSRDEIELPDTLSEWPEDLMTQFELSREWIQVA